MIITFPVNSMMQQRESVPLFIHIDALIQKPTQCEEISHLYRRVRGRHFSHPIHLP